jgi:hypothetical protein
MALLHWRYVMLGYPPFCWTKFDSSKSFLIRWTGVQMKTGCRFYTKS